MDVVKSLGVLEQKSLRELVELYNNLDDAHNVRTFRNKPVAVRAIAKYLAKQQANDGEYSRCTGHCCTSFVLNTDPDVLRKKAHTVTDGEYVLDMLRDAGVRADGAQVFACRHFDDCKKQCTDYTNRPEMCHKFPVTESCPYPGCTRAIIKPPPLLLVGDRPPEHLAGRADLWLRPQPIEHRRRYSETPDRLLKYTGWSHELYMATWARTFLLPYVVTDDNRREADREARQNACEVVGRVRRLHRAGLVCLGRQAASMFKWVPTEAGGRTTDPRRPSNVEYFKWRRVHAGDDMPSVPAIVIPHTAGIVRWWNDDNNKQTAREFFKHLAEEIAASHPVL